MTDQTAKKSCATSPEQARSLIEYHRLSLQCPGAPQKRHLDEIAKHEAYLKEHTDD